MAFLCRCSGHAYKQDTSREEAAKGVAPAPAAAPIPAPEAVPAAAAAPAPAVNAERPEADAAENEATILSMYHSLFAKRTRPSSAAQIDLTWN